VHVADAAAYPGIGLAAISHAADAHHVAALLVVRVRVEQIVCDVLEYGLDGRAAHLGERGVRIVMAVWSISVPW